MFSKKFLVVFLLTAAILLHVSTGQQNSTDSSAQQQQSGTGSSAQPSSQPQGSMASTTPVYRGVNLTFEGNNFYSQKSNSFDFVTWLSGIDAAQVQQNRTPTDFYPFIGFTLEDFIPEFVNQNITGAVTNSQLSQTTTVVTNWRRFVQQRVTDHRKIADDSSPIVSSLEQFNRKTESCSGTQLQFIHKLYENEVRVGEENDQLFRYLQVALRGSELPEGGQTAPASQPTAPASQPTAPASQPTAATSNYQSFHQFVQERITVNRQAAVQGESILTRLTLFQRRVQFFHETVNAFNSLSGSNDPSVLLRLIYDKQDEWTYTVNQWPAENAAHEWYRFVGDVLDRFQLLTDQVLTASQLTRFETEVQYYNTTLSTDKVQRGLNKDLAISMAIPEWVTLCNIVVSDLDEVIPKFARFVAKVKPQPASS